MKPCFCTNFGFFTAGKVLVTLAVQRESRTHTHTSTPSFTGMELSTFNHKLPYVSFIDPLWCRSEPGSTAFGESTCDGSKSSNAARVLCWNFSTWFHSGPKPMLRVILSSQKSQWEKEGKKPKKKKLMNTYALVIKLFWLHYALFFFLPTVSLFFLPFAVSQTHTFLSPSKGKSRLENRRMLDCTKAIRYSKINLGRLYYAAPVPAAMHICLASAHFRWLARWYCVFKHFLSATLQ